MSLIAHAFAQSTDNNNATTSTHDTTGANVLVVGVAALDGTPTLTDSAGNTYTAGT